MNSKYGKAIRKKRMEIPNYQELNRIEQAEALISIFQDNQNFPELVDLKREEIKCLEKL